MQGPAVEAKILPNRDGVSVLAGKHAVSEMLVFLMYRKLTGRVPGERISGAKPAGSGPGE